MGDDLPLDWCCPNELKVEPDFQWVTMEYLKLPSKNPKAHKSHSKFLFIELTYKNKWFMCKALGHLSD